MESGMHTAKCRYYMRRFENYYTMTKLDTIRQPFTLPERYRITGTIKLPRADTVYRVPRQIAPRLPK